jgi:hypothetical protein
MLVTISREQRNVVYAVVMTHLTGIGGRLDGWTGRARRLASAGELTMAQIADTCGRGRSTRQAARGAVKGGCLTAIQRPIPRARRGRR